MWRKSFINPHKPLFHKNSRTYNEDDTLRGYVITLQNFEKLLKEGQQKGLVTITEKTIDIKDEKPAKDDSCS